MKSIKHILMLLLALSLMLALCACAGGGSDTTATTEPGGNNQQTEAEETTGPVNTTPVYKVMVVDEQNKPMAGVQVQLCQGTNCQPNITDVNGVAQFTTEEADYEVKLMKMPEGYTYSTTEEVFTFTSGSYELTITLKAAA